MRLGTLFVVVVWGHVMRLGTVVLSCFVGCGGGGVADLLEWVSVAPCPLKPMDPFLHQPGYLSLAMPPNGFVL